jgi:AcrR family transcriptional regulator
VPGTRNRRAALLTAALDAFARRGYDATSVAELAAATGMSKAAVSYHFRTKNDLLHAVADPLLDSLDALLERHPPVPRWPDQVLALLGDYLAALTEHRQVAAWVDSDKAVLNHPQIGAPAAPQHRAHLPGDHRPHRGRRRSHRARHSRARIPVAPAAHADPGPPRHPPRRPAPRRDGRLRTAHHRPDPPHTRTRPHTRSRPEQLRSGRGGTAGSR